MNTTTVTILPPGKYWIGDLCYVMHRSWGRACDEIFCADGYEKGGEFEFDGHKGWFHVTAYGDGDYPSNVGMRFGVDAGLIGIIPEMLVGTEQDDDPGTGAWVITPSPMTAHYLDGKFHFTNNAVSIIIDTGIEDEEC